MKTDQRVTVWLTAGGLGLLVLGFLWLTTTPWLISGESTVVSTPLTKNTTTTTVVKNARILPEVTDTPKLLRVDYPPGSVGEACEVNEFPSYVGYYDTHSEKRRIKPGEKDPFMALKNEECHAALERYIYSINPYLWGAKDEKRPTSSRIFSFVIIDNPLTFERIFKDPVGDFTRVQEALARPECQLGQEAKSNWHLNETCHAAAILNYALLTRFCYDEHFRKGARYQSSAVYQKDYNGIANRYKQRYYKMDNPTPEQDRGMWIQALEGDWVRKKCESLDPVFDLRLSVHTDLLEQIQTLQGDNHKNEPWDAKSFNAGLIELAARLGDDAAELTQPFSPNFGSYTYREEGYKYGRLAGWITNKFKPNELFTKLPPSVDRLRQLVPLFAKNIGARGGKLIKFDHEALVRHLCTPPYYNTFSDSLLVPEPPSCREIINELRQESLHPSMLEVIDTFEDVAIRLDVYE